MLAAVVDELAVKAASYAASDDTAGALRALVVHMVTEGAAHDLAARLHVSAGDSGAALSDAVAKLDRATGLLLTRARDAGAIRDDIDERDLAAIVAAALAAYVHPFGRDRVVALVLRALD